MEQLVEDCFAVYLSESLAEEQAVELRLVVVVERLSESSNAPCNDSARNSFTNINFLSLNDVVCLRPVSFLCFRFLLCGTSI